MASLTDETMKRYQDIASTAMKQDREEEEKIPEGYDGTISIEDYKVMQENIDMEGTYYSGKLSGSIQFAPKDNLFFRSKKDATEALFFSLDTKSEFSKRLRAAFDHNLEALFFRSWRFQELLEALPVELRSILRDWMVLVASSAGVSGLEELGFLTHKLLLEYSSLFNMAFTSTTLRNYLSCWKVEPQDDGEGSTGENPSTNVHGLQNIINLSEIGLKTTDAEAVLPCILLLVRFSLTNHFDVSKIIGRLVSLSSANSTDGWLRSLSLKVLSGVNDFDTMGMDRSCRWLTLAAAVKLFSLSSTGTVENEFAIFLCTGAVEQCLDVKVLAECTEQNLDTRTLSDLTLTGSARGALLNTLRAMYYLKVHFESFGTDGERCLAAVECISQLFRLGFDLGPGNSGNAVTSSNATIVYEYTSTLLKLGEDVSSSVSKRTNDTLFQRADMSLRHLLRFVRGLRETAEAKIITPRAQTQISSFFSPNTVATPSSVVSDP